MSETVTLTEFLLARIAEDEALAERAGSFTPWGDAFQKDNYGHLTVQPARVLAECEAKRRIVEAHPERWWIRRLGDESSAEGIGVCDVCTDDDGDWDGPRPHWWPCPTLRALATIYADHPDYDEAWRP